MAAEVPPTQAPPPRDPNEVKAALDAIDFEISEVRGAHRGSGWTSWGVLAALAAVAWLMADVLKTETVSERVVLRLFFLGSIIVEIVVGLASLFGIQYPLFPARDERRLRMGWGLPLNGVEVLLVLGRSAILLWVIASGWPDVSPLLRVLAYVYVTIALPVILFALAIRAFFAFPTQVSVSRSMVRFQVLTGVVVLLWTVALLWQYTSAFFRGTYATVADYQLAGLLVASFILLGRFARLYRHAPTLLPLLDVRRNLVFSRISPSEAMRRVESIIVGKTGAELVTEAMESLQLRHGESKIYKRAMRNADRLAQKHRTEGGPGIVPDAEVEKWWKRDVGRWGREQKWLGWEMKWLMFRLNFLTSGDPAADEVATRELKRMAADGFGRAKLLIALMDRRLALLGKTRPTEPTPPDKDSP